jgi:GTP cyclohydrolase II
MPFAVVDGEPLTQLPQDLYIPPYALQVFLEAFEGPLDLLLYLIRRQNLNVLVIPIAEITRQYVQYIGLMNKLRAYQLQDTGLDTVDANQHLGFDPDERSFRVAANMLRHLGIDRIRLLTNNPLKVDAMAVEGVEVVERVRHAMPPNPHNQTYLETKMVRSGHLIDS